MNLFQNITYYWLEFKIHQSSKSFIVSKPVEVLDEEKMMTSDEREEDEGNSPGSRREGETKGSRGVRTGHPVKWKTPHTLETGERRGAFSSLSCLLGYGLPCHFIVCFEIHSLKLDVVGSLPWVSTAGLKMSVIWLFLLFKAGFFFFYLSMLWFFLPYPSQFLLSSYCCCNHIVSVIHLLSRKKNEY